MTPLSTGHISPQLSETVRIGIKQHSPRFIYYPGASMIEVKHQRYEMKSYQHGGGIRSEITQFTRKSRKRLMSLLGQLDKTCIPLFGTLTYPENFTADARTWKRDLDNLDKRMARKFPDSAMVWKLEPQKRGAPHFHLLVWGVDHHQLRSFLPFAWAEVVGSDDKNHLLWHLGLLGNGNKHCVQKVRSWRGVRSYASKYMGKIIDMPLMQESGWASPGRFWGVRRRQNLPAVVAQIIELDDYSVYEFLRYMRRYANIKARRYRSLSIMVENPARWAELLK
jgi:hypothetical protein